MKQRNQTHEAARAKLLAQRFVVLELLDRERAEGRDTLAAAPPHGLPVDLGKRFIVFAEGGNWTRAGLFLEQYAASQRACDVLAGTELDRPVRRVGRWSLRLERWCQERRNAARQGIGASAVEHDHAVRAAELLGSPSFEHDREYLRQHVEQSLARGKRLRGNHGDSMRLHTSPTCGAPLFVRE